MFFSINYVSLDIFTYFPCIPIFKKNITIKKSMRHFVQIFFMYTHI